MAGTTPQAPPETVGAEVRRLRERTGRSIREVSQQLGWSGSKLSRIETGQSNVSSDDLTKLLRTFDARPDDRQRIEILARQKHSLPKRALHALPGTLERYVALEERATTISIFAAILVPALLQTPEYAATVIKANPQSTGFADKVRIENRMIRQAVLARQAGPRLNVVLDEAVLRRAMGDANIMRRQMLRLIELSERPTTSIRVLPFSVGVHPAQTGHLAILDFDDGLQPHVFSDGLTGGVLRNKPEDVQLCRLCFQATVDVALDVHESVRMIADAANGDWAR